MTKIKIKNEEVSIVTVNQTVDDAMVAHGYDPDTVDYTLEE